MGADSIIEDLYRQCYADRSISPDENADLVATLQELMQIQDGSTTPPTLTPDKIVWVRAAAFRIACEYLVDDDAGVDDPRDENVKLLKTINGVVHALETTCLLPSLDEEGGEDFSKEGVEELFTSLYETEDEDGDGDEDDGPVVISTAEATSLENFLTDEATRPPLSMLIWLRSTAFRLGSQYLNDENDKARNVALLRSINVVVHIIEKTCMK